METIEIDVEIVSDPTSGVTIATIDGYDFGDFVGSSKTTGPDKFDPLIGRSLASARALRNFADAIEQSALGLVDEIDLERAVRRAKNDKARAKKSKQNIRISGIKGSYVIPNATITLNTLADSRFEVKATAQPVENVS